MVNVPAMAPLRSLGQPPLESGDRQISRTIPLKV